MRAATLLVVLLLLARRGGAQTGRTPCLTTQECDERRQRLGLTQFYVGEFAAKGCFKKGQRAYFGTGGSAADRSEAALSGAKERLWCEEGEARPATPPPTRAPAPPAPPTAAAPSRSACLTEHECDRRRRELGLASYKVGDYPVKGCFKKGGRAYFGTGGGPDEAAAPLAGRKQRLWCDAPTPDPAHCIDIEVTTGELYRDGRAGFTLSTRPGSNGTAPETLVDVPVGSLGSRSEHWRRACYLPAGAYALVVVGRATYAARVGGEEVLAGASAWGRTRAHALLVGPPAVVPRDAEERAWLAEHNAVRAAYHAEHGRDYRPLRWSSGLAERAAARAAALLPGCAYAREPDLEEGELVALHKYRARAPRETEAPANILPRWTRRDDKLSQVVWRATRYVGCATRFERRGQHSYCHVSVCRYVRPGNCGINSDNWQAKALEDHSLCGAACPPEGCH